MNKTPQVVDWQAVWQQGQLLTGITNWRDSGIGSWQEQIQIEVSREQYLRFTARTSWRGIVRDAKFQHASVLLPYFLLQQAPILKYDRVSQHMSVSQTGRCYCCCCCCCCCITLPYLDPSSRSAFSSVRSAKSFHDLTLITLTPFSVHQCASVPVFGIV